MIGALTQRVFYHVVGRPFLRSLVLPMFVALLSVAFLDAMTDWTLVRRQLAALAPWQQTTVFTTLILGWSWRAGRALRPVWRQRAMAFLVRQPIGRGQWVIGLLPSLSIAFVPVAAIWWLAPHRAGPFVHYAAFVGLAWPLVLGASYRGAPSVVLVAAGTLSLAASILAYAYSPWFAYAALLATILQLPSSVAWIPCQISRVYDPITGDLAGSGVVVTLMRRDLRCAFRTGWKGFLNLAALGIVATGMMWAFRLNGGVEERDAFLTACVLFSVAASPVYEVLERMKVALGEDIMRRRWPVTHRQRAFALGGVVAVLASPVAVLLAIGGATMGSAYLLLFAAFVAVTIAVCSALYCGLLQARRSGVTAYYMAITANAIIALALPAPAYAFLALTALPAGFVLASRSLWAFTARLQRMPHDPPA